MFYHGAGLFEHTGFYRVDRGVYNEEVNRWNGRSDHVAKNNYFCKFKKVILLSCHEFVTSILELRSVVNIYTLPIFIVLAFIVFWDLVEVVAHVAFPVGFHELYKRIDICSTGATPRYFIPSKINRRVWLFLLIHVIQPKKLLLPHTDYNTGRSRHTAEYGSLTLSAATSEIYSTTQLCIPSLGCMYRPALCNILRYSPVALVFREKTREWYLDFKVKVVVPLNPILET